MAELDFEPAGFVKDGAPRRRAAVARGDP